VAERLVRHVKFRVYPSKISKMLGWSVMSLTLGHSEPIKIEEQLCIYRICVALRSPT
jgi:hypothetical protein